MIKFQTCEYTLAPKESLNSVAGMTVRQGSLLKMEWPDKKVGYADLAPWPEFGDLPIAEQLARLAKGHLTPLVEQSIWLGRKDAILRSSNKGVLDGVPKLKNHYSVADFTKCADSHLNSAKSGGFGTLKVKVGRDWSEELKWIIKILRQYPFVIRLDFNSHTDFSTFERMMTGIPSGLKHKLDYVEDPFPFDMSSWTEAAKLAPLAVDFEYDNVPWKTEPTSLPFKHLVLKPARQDVDLALRRVEKYGLRVSVSSSMDHPIGVSHAVRVASELKLKLANALGDCGCLTTRLFNPNEFSTKMIIQGPYITKIPGLGVGFDDTLAGQKWKPVVINPVTRR